MDEDAMVAEVRRRLRRINESAGALTRALGLPPEAKHEVIARMAVGERSAPAGVSASNNFRIHSAASPSLSPSNVIFIGRLSPRLAAGGITTRWALPFAVTTSTSRPDALPRSLSMQLSQVGANPVYLQTDDWPDPGSRQTVVIALEPPDEPSPLDPALRLEEWVVRGETTVTLDGETTYIEESVASPGHPLTRDEQVALARYFHTVTFAIPAVEAEP